MKWATLASILIVSQFAIAIETRSVPGEYFRDGSILVNGSDIKFKYGAKAREYCTEKGYKGMMAYYFEIGKLTDVFCSNDPRAQPKINWARTIIMRDRKKRGAALRNDASTVLHKNAKLKFSDYKISDLSGGTGEGAVQNSPGDGNGSK
jgi:hypothetical protein